MCTVTFRKSGLFEYIAFTVLAAFIGLLPMQAGYAQVALVIPPPGQMIHTTRHFEPPQMIGLKINLKDPFSFNFIMDQGQSPMSDAAQKEEFNKIIKYFLVSLAMPNKDMWVNLSPYESKRVMPEVFAQTEMGRDLLAQDYVLKQFTASLIYPQDGLGKEFWDKVYQQARARFGTTNISVNTFNKVWIVADKADIYQKNDTAFLIYSHLKVMLDQDYMALEKHSASALPQSSVNALGSQLVREIIIPAIEKEVNEGRNFAVVRQVYNAEIMATWYKKTLKKSLLGEVFADRSKIAGQKINDPQAMEKIYQRYLKAYKKGVFNFIKEDVTPDGQDIPRKYFSGGAEGVLPVVVRSFDPAMEATWPTDFKLEFNLFKRIGDYVKERWRNVFCSFVNEDAENLRQGTYNGFTVHGDGVRFVGGVLEVADGKKGYITVNGRKMVYLRQGDQWVFGGMGHRVRKDFSGAISIGAGRALVKNIEPGLHDGILVRGEGVRNNRGVLEVAEGAKGDIIVGSTKLEFENHQWVTRAADPITHVMADHVVGVVQDTSDGVFINSVQFDVPNPEFFNLSNLGVQDFISPGVSRLIAPIKAEYTAWEKSLANAKLRKMLLGNQEDRQLQNQSIVVGQADYYFHQLDFISQRIAQLILSLEKKGQALTREENMELERLNRLNQTLEMAISYLDVQLNEFRDAFPEKLQDGISTKLLQKIGIAVSRAEERARARELSIASNNESMSVAHEAQSVAPEIQAIPVLENQAGSGVNNGLSIDFAKLPYTVTREQIVSGILKTDNYFSDSVLKGVPRSVAVAIAPIVDDLRLYEEALQKIIDVSQDANVDHIEAQARALVMAQARTQARFYYNQFSARRNEVRGLLGNEITDGTTTQKRILSDLSSHLRFAHTDMTNAARVVDPEILDTALAVNGDMAVVAKPVGGINLSDENLTMNIKLDGQGMPLPARYQDQSMMNLNGLVSIIRHITPVTPQNLPSLYDVIKK